MSFYLFIFILFFFFLSFHWLFCPCYSAIHWILERKNNLLDLFPFFLGNRGCPCPCLATAENFQKAAFTQNKARGSFLVTCPNFVLITFNRSTQAARAQRLGWKPELQRQKKSWAGDRGSFLSRGRHMLSAPIIFLFKNNFKNGNEFWPDFPSSSSSLCLSLSEL